MPNRLPLAAALAVFTFSAHAQGLPGAEWMGPWDIDGDRVITLEEVRAKRGEMFYRFDVEGDGRLGTDDLAGVAAHLAEDAEGKGPSAAMRGAMVPRFNDADGDGVVTLAEFEAATDRLFAALDRNADGIVTAADFALP